MTNGMGADLDVRQLGERRQLRRSQPALRPNLAGGHVDGRREVTVDERLYGVRRSVATVVEGDGHGPLGKGSLPTERSRELGDPERGASRVSDRVGMRVEARAGDRVSAIAAARMVGDRVVQEYRDDGSLLRHRSNSKTHAVGRW